MSQEIEAKYRLSDPQELRRRPRGLEAEHRGAVLETNHYFDASYMADVAANMCGINLLTETKVAPVAGGWFDAQKKPRKPKI